MPKKTNCLVKIHWRYARASISSGDMYWRAATLAFSSGLALTDSKDPLLLSSKSFYLISSKQKQRNFHVVYLIHGSQDLLVQEQVTSVGMIALSSHFK